MVEFASNFWSLWVIGLTLLSLAALVWLLFSVYFSKHKEERGVVWDETLREGAHPPPMWWFWLLLAVLVFSLGYLALFPGLGNYPGALGWSQHSRLVKSERDFARAYGEARARWANAELAELAADPDAMRSAARVYQNYCAACHGRDARGGARMFPNLRDFEWQWGGGEEEILHSLREGRRAAMPAWGEVLGEEGVNAVAAYVLALSGGAADNPRYARGREIYAQFCVSCHGAAGGGNPQIGAPNLANDTWLYGRSASAVRASIKEGRNGEMPAWKTRLDETQIRLLAAWLLSGAETK